ncbi:MAG: SPOR domain-containing protein [Saprospiraceae bacterium]|nr:SPOR domain-containing protein [Saprospiraceae bacterium]
MNTNKLLNYVLIAILAGLVVVLVYKACEKKQEEERFAQENAEFQQTLRDFGYIESDTAGSSFSGDDNAYTDPAPNQPTVTKDGIEYETPQPKTTTTNQPKTTQPASQPAKTPITQPVPKTEAPTKVSTSSTSSDGRYRVVAGTFTILDGARREMERLIKMGYHDAEVGKYNRGKYAVVIIKRTDSLSAARRLVDELKRKGVDARVVDRDRK